MEDTDDSVKWPRTTSRKSARRAPSEPTIAGVPAREAKAALEAALALDETALGGAAHTTLGTLYHRLPGFPISFGSDRQARGHLERALQISPDAIDPNYFYDAFLYEEGDYASALEYLERALRAPPRPGRQLADSGRRAEIQALIAKIEQQ